ncbi:MAG: hypothetical protein BGO45_14045 [Microbacterium sp. 71-36]|nr:hypothetical protein [Microbacterium sp.]ODT39230.1 MAG: hypothetical protein ABS60_07140 [Microbacterium sp. SCN 71-17]OJV77829.1 MAG: hypothetical protein BGO45_14045 [Microbacterium sp. 71-36]
MQGETDLDRARRMLYRRADLLDRGVAEAALRRAGVEGAWHRLCPGVYVDRRLYAPLRPAERHLLSVVAAVDQARGAIGVVSHLSAAVLHGLPLYRFDAERVAVTVAATAHPPSGPRVRRHTDALHDGDVVEISGIRCTSMDRTIIDVARTEPLEAALSCADAALRREVMTGRRFDSAAQDEWRERMRIRTARAAGSRGIRNARRIVEFADGRAELPGESVSRLQLHRLGFRDLDLQVPVEGPHRSMYYVDLALREVKTFWEFDGEVKYRDAAMRKGGSVEDVLLQEKRREDWIRGSTQWRLCRGGFSDIATPETLARRLAAFGVRSPR